MGISDTGDEFDTIAETIAESKPVPTSLDLGFDLEVDEAIPEGKCSRLSVSFNLLRSIILKSTTKPLSFFIFFLIFDS